MTDAAADYDVVVVGGALAGAATALLLRREDPSLRVLIIEKNDAFKRRVGEATVEISAYFFCRVLGLTQFLTQTQLAKNGLRFWFSNERSGNLGGCSEIGGQYLSTVPSFLVDRAVLDEEVLRRAVAEGSELLRPAAVESVHLESGSLQTLKVRAGEESRTLRTRWVVDASGVRCLLARAHGWWRSFDAHPTLSAWARFRGVPDWDSAGLVSRHPSLGSPFVGIRGTATNHLTGYGWWAWLIALKGGDTSVGVVIDPRRASWPEGDAGPAEKLRAFLGRHAATAELLGAAEPVAGDAHFRRHLPYRSTVMAGDGFVLTGDASAFLDPFYSPGMDWLTFSVSAAIRTILTWRRGEALEPVLAGHNRDFETSYQRMFEALYENKYDYLGDFDLMRIALRLDIALYYLFVARPIFFEGTRLLPFPAFSVREALPIYALMKVVNRRLASIGHHRHLSGRFGINNQGRRDLFAGFNFRISHLLKIIGGAVWSWLRLEATEGWKSWGGSKAGCRDLQPESQTRPPQNLG